MVAQEKLTSHQKFQHLLVEIHEFKGQTFDLEFCNERLSKGILAFGSETPDNLECVKHIEYGSNYSGNGKNERWGLKLKNTSILLTDLMEALSECPVPSNIRYYFPDLTAKEWQDATTFSHLLFIDVEAPAGLMNLLQEAHEAGFSKTLNPILVHQFKAELKRIAQSVEQPFSLNNVVFGIENTPYIRWGARLEEYAFISDIFNELESGEMPEQVKMKFPVSAEQWSAAMRLATLVLSAFEGEL